MATVKSKSKSKSKTKKSLTSVAIGAATITGISLLGIGVGKAIKLKLEKQIREKIENENLQAKYHEFLACDQTVKPFGTKSVFDKIPLKLVDKILVKFKNMQDINNQCLINEKIKKYCCDNRMVIFTEILKYNGYKKGIKLTYAEIIFSWFNGNGIKVLDFYIKNYDFSDRTLSVFILLSLNNKFTSININNEMYWNYYPIIYYYTPSSSIKNCILKRYNQLTIPEIQSKPSGYYFYPGTNFNLDYLNNNFCNKLGNLNHNTMKMYAILEIDYIKTIPNLYIDY